METTPKDLAKMLGVSELRIRNFLRSEYRPNGENKYSRWKLDDAIVARVVAHFSK